MARAGSTSTRGRRGGWLLGLLCLVGGALGLVQNSRAEEVEEPRFALVRKYSDFEIRRYAPSVIARTEVRASRERSLGKGFRRLASFIFGKNAAQMSIAMTAPVGRLPSKDGFHVTFTMPASHSLKTLPAPDDPRVEILRVPSRVVAALAFSGWAREARVEVQMARLAGAMKKRGLPALGPPELAQYDAPWVPGPMRRNEILVPTRVPAPAPTAPGGPG